ncbi:phage holin family protein [Orenia marismortui]|uniref:Superfamily IV 4 TMS phage holin n=1 Tax=Orenia marismortui TaxID=46469 RepID=A0A4R8H041_9FIRM|nr:phage holin family protein [Orenia marismortui]TDX51081.1 superfamily IV 4 TMS phage holin [Orenia marismortui]
MAGWLGAIVRFIVSAFVLLAVGYLVPGVSVASFTSALIASIVIAFLGYIVENFFGENISPQARGLTGFVTSAIVIYFTAKLLAGMQVSFIGSLLAALVIGIVDSFVPTELR